MCLSITYICSILIVNIPFSIIHFIEQIKLYRTRNISTWKWRTRHLIVCWYICLVVLLFSSLSFAILEIHMFVNNSMFCTILLWMAHSIEHTFLYYCTYRSKYFQLYAIMKFDTNHHQQQFMLVIFIHSKRVSFHDGEAYIFQTMI